MLGIQNRMNPFKMLMLAKAQSSERAGAWWVVDDHLNGAP